MFHIYELGNLPVYIKLILLVVKEKTTTCFEYWKMTWIGVHKQIFVFLKIQSKSSLCKVIICNKLLSVKYLTFRFEIISLHTFFDKLDLTSTICPAFSGRRTVQV